MRDDPWPDRLSRPLVACGACRPAGPLVAPARGAARAGETAFSRCTTAAWPRRSRTDARTHALVAARASDAGTGCGHSRLCRPCAQPARGDRIRSPRRRGRRRLGRCARLVGPPEPDRRCARRGEPGRKARGDPLAGRSRAGLRCRNPAAQRLGMVGTTCRDRAAGMGAGPARLGRLDRRARG